MVKKSLMVTLLLAGLGTVYFLGRSLSKSPKSELMQGTPSKDVGKSSEQDNPQIPEMEFRYVGSLIDITGGNAEGLAKSNFDQNYTLSAEFSNLPPLTNGDFYEGWIVRKDPFDFISTGKTTIVDGSQINSYSSDQDLTDYDFYVLTIEPDDNDPSPAKHILEGTMIPVQ